MNFDVNHLYLTTEGRIGRRDFWIGVIALVVVSLVIGVVLGLIFGWISFATRAINFIVQLALAYPGYALMAKRFQDRGKPGTYAAVIIGINILYALLSLIGLTGTPVEVNLFGQLYGVVMLAIGIWVLVELGILRGTVGENAYGPDPLRG